MRHGDLTMGHGMKIGYQTLDSIHQVTRGQPGQNIGWIIIHHFPVMKVLSGLGKPQ